MLSIRLLGEIDVMRDGERRPLPPSRKTRALLAYLALTGRPHRRERLCSLLWEIPDDPRGALRWSLSKLRPIVDEPGLPRIMADRDLVGFDAAGAEIDILSVRRALAAGVDAQDTDGLRSLAGAFRGELLEGQDFPDQPDFQAWCMAEREDARRLQAQVLAALVDRLRERPEAALPFARTLVQQQPYDEAARVGLLRLLFAAGRHGEAEQQFEAGQRILREMGIGAAALTAAWRTLKSAAVPKNGDVSAPPRSTSPTPRRDMPLAPCGPADGAALIGRRSEMRRLLAALGEVEGGGGVRVVLLKGEPGLGKSALVLELARAANARIGDVLLGHAYEVERDQPFGPWIEALGGLPALDAVGGAVPDLGRGDDVAVARERLFASVVETVTSRARQRPPLLLMLEDIHWLDEASAALMHHLVRAVRRAPVLMVLTAREGELPDNPPVLGALRSLRHDRLLAEIPLGPMPPEEIAGLARCVAPQVDAQRIVAESGGNPLLAQELARALADGADGVPRTLQGLVRDRIERLPVAAADVLRWAAILGPSVPIDRLGALLAMELADFMAALDTLERHALLQEAVDGTGTGGGYAFRHDLIHRAVYTGLSEPRRRLMHLKIARTLQDSDPADEAVAAEIAHHAALGGDGALAAQACVAAGRRCLRLLAGAEAELFARRGMRHAERLREPDRTRFTLELLHIQLAASRPGVPADIMRQVEELSERALDHGCLHHARLGFHMLSHLRWEGGLWSDAERDTLRAELVSRSADEKVRVVALAEAARCLAILERDLGQAEAFALEARALSQRHGIEPNAVADALGMLRLHQGATQEAAALFAQARASARRDGERTSEFMALEHLVLAEFRRGRFDRAQALCHELTDLADRLRHDGSEAPYARALGALCHLAHGDTGAEAELGAALEALAVADAKHRLACALICAAELDSRAGRQDRARTRAKEALRLASLLDLPSEMACAHAALAGIAGAMGDEAARRAHCDALRGLRARNLSHHAQGLAEALAPDEPRLSG